MLNIKTKHAETCKNGEKNSVEIKHKNVEILKETETHLKIYEKFFGCILWIEKSSIISVVCAGK
jgi:hypothetical protein